jgi:hypothetical protein
VVTTPCIPVPSPDDIARKLFPRGRIEPVALPAVWSASVLLTPFGGLAKSALQPSDQLVVGHVTYDASDSASRLMRVGLYLLESLLFYDLLFETADGRTQWWWLISDPAAPDALPAKAIGPFDTAAVVPATDFLSVNGLTHAGTWQICGRACDAFSGRRQAPAGTWCWCDTQTGDLARIMSIDPGNDFRVPILGAYFLVDLPAITKPAASNLREVRQCCAQAAPPSAPAPPILTLSELLAAMASPPTGGQMPCTWDQIQSLFPDLAPPTGAEPPPAWSDRVSSECVMIRTETDRPYYSQVWYDWGRGVQVTVFVEDDGTAYVRRHDLMLLKHDASGPAIVYATDAPFWTPSYCIPKQAGVPMPIPNFVERRHGRCRALIKQHPRWGTLSIWSVPLGDGPEWAANFWYWFDEQNRQRLFSLAPPNYLTMTDYQTFVRDAAIDACILDNPCPQLPTHDPALTAFNPATFFLIA